MHMISALLFGAPDAHGSRRRADLVQDLLWAHSDPEDAVQHIRVRPHPVGLEAVLLLGGRADGAATAVVALLGRSAAPLSRQGYTALPPGAPVQPPVPSGPGD
ncbi:hypothetical protein [Streptomyces sp. NPDC089919]|uniref:hypothetical protein n=1 Tax=Streptomyces sp. NPDC089919 TaxID=3155188 RepID=UPI003416F5EA